MGLAGPKIKQRISADPRNLAWSNDQTKFGYKMLSKMGWSPGKGLGINEDGEIEHIKLSHKQDNLGIGATKKTADNWLDNSSAFDELLKGLNNGKEKGEKGSEQDTSDEMKFTQVRPKKKKTNKKEKGEKSREQDTSDEMKFTQVKPKKKKTNKKENKNKNKKSISPSLSTYLNNNDSTAKDSDSPIRLAHRAKFLKSKKAAIQNSDRLNEIFGIKSNKNSIDDFNNTDISTTITTITTMASSASSASSSDHESNTEDSKEKIRKIDIITKVNEMSTHEYFAQKMRGLKISGIASSGLVSYNKTNDNIDERPSFNMGSMNNNVSSKDDNSKSTSSSKKRKADYDRDIDLVNDNSGDDKSIKSGKKLKKKRKEKNKSKEYRKSAKGSIDCEKKGKNVYKN